MDGEVMRPETGGRDRKILKSDNLEIGRILHLKLEIRNHCCPVYLIPKATKHFSCYEQATKRIVADLKILQVLGPSFFRSGIDGSRTNGFQSDLAVRLLR
jgi:hypothetical protein